MSKSNPTEKIKRSRAPVRLHLSGTDSQARRVAAVILEVLAGERTPREAAESLGISVVRYYLVEARALGGLVEACRPRPKGRVIAPEKETALLCRQIDKLKTECARRTALLRSCQRAVGLSAAPARVLKTAGKRQRRPTVRALKAARLLKTEAAAGSSENEKENQ